MTTIYLTGTQENTLIAADKIWCNLLLAKASNSEKVVGDGEGNDYFLFEIQAMTDEEICALKLYGKKSGIIQNTTALTEDWDIPMQCHNDPAKWVIKKPDNSLMTGVVNCTEAPRDPDWWAPEE